MNVQVHHARTLPESLPRLAAFAMRGERVPLSRHPAWLLVLRNGLKHEPYCLEAIDSAAGRTRGILPLALVRSVLFGRYLVGLPYLNYGGVTADDDQAAVDLIARAAELAETHNVKRLELRHERPIDHPAFNRSSTGKVHMRRPLPDSSNRLWDELSPKVRNQIRKGRKFDPIARWGGHELLEPFYQVFSRNMRDLGTPVYSRRLFASVLETFPSDAELCVIEHGGKPVAGALLLHGSGVTEVPSASSLKEANPTCANMVMYWELLERTVNRGQAEFDFGRSSPDSGPYQFKSQWGAIPHPTEWQYRVRIGDLGDARPDNPKYQRMIRVWKRLPLPLTRLIGPPIVRGIP